MNRLSEIKKQIQKQANPAKARILQRFFKTGKGEYGEGDMFLGLTVPKQRMIANKFADLPLKDIEKLLKSKIHEHRLIALLILVEKYSNSDHSDAIRGFGSHKQIYDFYLANSKCINNWDLVDLSAEKIIGRFLYDTKTHRKVVYHLAKSKNLWERRIAILSTFYFIKNNQFTDTLKIAEKLLSDKNDLIHKAVGWMLREIGKRNVKVLEKFLESNYKKMPRTALRYAIERLPEKVRKGYLLGEV